MHFTITTHLEGSESVGEDSGWGGVAFQLSLQRCFFALQLEAKALKLQKGSENTRFTGSSGLLKESGPGHQAAPRTSGGCAGKSLYPQGTRTAAYAAARVGTELRKGVSPGSLTQEGVLAEARSSGDGQTAGPRVGEALGERACLLDLGETWQPSWPVVSCPLRDAKAKRNYVVGLFPPLPILTNDSVCLV